MLVLVVLLLLVLILLLLVLLLLLRLRGAWHAGPLLSAVALSNQVRRCLSLSFHCPLQTAIDIAVEFDFNDLEDLFEDHLSASKQEL